MNYPPQLNPVQAWLLGYIDCGTLLDQVTALEGEDLKAQARSLGRARSDQAYADSLIAEAHRVLEPEPPSGPGAGERVLVAALAVRS
jgi:hypothetical protein